MESWRNITLNLRGESVEIDGVGFSSIGRLELLTLLQARVRSVGVTAHYETQVDSIDRFAGYDLVIAADGLNSLVRRAFEAEFGTSVTHSTNKFAWYGTTKTFATLSQTFVTAERGTFNAHHYRYSPDMSTFLVECDAATWNAYGFEHKSIEQSQAICEEIFADVLDGHRLISNKSVWRNFPWIWNERWSHRNMVLIGDALHTAHFSIGSGTKLAMEDAIELFRTLKAHRLDVAATLAAYETGRREEVEKTQHAADVSLVWFEHIDRFWTMDPKRFAFGLMTRSKAITYDNLALRAPAFVDEVGRMVAREVREAGFDVDADTPAPPAFQPFRLREMELANRFVMSPMDQYSAVDGLPTDWHLVHYGSRALGGAGLMFTEMVCVSPEGRITKGCPGLYTDAQEAAWKRIVDFVRAHAPTKVALQLGHSGRKARASRPWEGDRPLTRTSDIDDWDEWTPVAPSAIPHSEKWPVPRALERNEVKDLVQAWGRAARRAHQAGFEVLELHGAHGYLMHEFLSERSNQRSDEYGGSEQNRMRFAIEVTEAVRAHWPDEKPLFVRLSVEDNAGWGPEQSVRLARILKAKGVDVIDCSSGGITDVAPILGKEIKYSYQVPLSEYVRRHADIMTMAVGLIIHGDQAEDILRAGQADLIAVGREILNNPNWPMDAALKLGVEGPFRNVPPQFGYWLGTRAKRGFGTQPSTWQSGLNETKAS